jgi:ATP-dependent DNA ligase
MSSFERLALRPPIEPMETRQAADIPPGPQWLYEPKWDGFRCVAFRDGRAIELESKSGQSLTRYFPEIVDALSSVAATRFVVDGELVIESGDGFDFDALLQRIHPAASRVRLLSEQTPARYVVFDLLADDRDDALYEQPLSKRRMRLDAFSRKHFVRGGALVLSPVTDDRDVAQRWLAGDLVRLDGVIAKRADVAYAFGSRDAALKIKRNYTADCVVGGFREGAGGAIASLLLGLYDRDKLDHVGFVGSMSAADRERAGKLLRPIVGAPGFSGNAPGGPSRWRKSGEETQWFPVQPKVVVEVSFDHVTGRRFRHAARLLRWRPDKAPRQCTIDQLLRPKSTSTSARRFDRSRP